MRIIAARFGDISIKPLLILVLAVALFTAAGCEYQPEKQNILLIIVDTLRADHLGAYGYARPISPHIDALAQEGALFEQAYSHSPWTMPSVASIMTSLPPRDHGITNWKQPLAEQHLTLAEYLKDRGYSTAGVVSHFIFEPKYHFNQGFDFFDLSVLEKGHPKKIHSSKEISDIGIRVLTDFAGRPEPFFLWLHYFDPHNDYLKHEGYDFGDKPVDRYDSEIAYTDHHVGRVLRQVDELGLRENTIVVFVADHGEEFRDHGGTRHSHTLYNEVLRIPLIIRVPGFKPQRIGAVVKESDIAPTLLQLTGQPVPTAFHGESFEIKRKKLLVKTPRTVIAETYRFAKKKGVVHRNWKLIRDIKMKRYELFDLATDPGEKVNLYSSNKLMAGKLKTLLKEHYKIKRAKVEEKPLDSDLEEKLRSLGYIN